jgi:HAD superfamily hydrolase (TIGR01509 family)
VTRTVAIPDAVAFDCDGTIADTESLSQIAWAEVLSARGVAWTMEDHQRLVGRTFADNWASFRERADLGDIERFRAEIRTCFRALFDGRLEVYEDVVLTMREAAARGIGIAVVSSSTHDHIARVLDRAGVAGLVEHVVGSGDTAAHKPAPDPYLAACRLLDVDPARAVAVEDTPTGARASQAAGLWTVAVRRPHTAADIDRHADLVVDELAPRHLGITH